MTPDPIVAELAARRVRLRVPKGVLAQRAGVSVHTIRRLELGLHCPSVHTAQLIAKALGMRLCLLPEVPDA